MAQAGVAEPVCQSSVIAFGFLSVEQQSQPLGMIEFASLGVVSQFGEGARHAVQLEMLELVEAGPSDILNDLGCGDGRFLITAVAEFKVEKAVGYELNKHLYKVAEDNVARRGLIDEIRIESGDFMDADFSEATIITLYLTTSGNAKLRPKFKEELKPGTRIISHDFPIMGWTLSTPDGEALSIGEHKLFIYRIPDAYTENEEKKESPSGDRWGRIKRLFERL